MNTQERPRASASIAVVVPVFNAESFVEEALDSIAGQTRVADECIVVDDGSTDATADTVRDWTAAHPQVPVRLLERAHEGAAAARTAGVMAATADLVALLDADDLFFPHALLTLEAGFDVWPNMVACFANAERTLVGHGRGDDYLAGKPVLDLPHEEREVPLGDGSIRLRRISSGLFESLLGGSYIANGAALVSRAAALSAGLWSHEFETAEDRDFWLRLSRLGSFAYSTERVARVRYHGANLTSSRGDAAHITDGARVLQKMRRMAVALELDPGERAAVDEALERAIDEALYSGSLAGPLALRGVVRRLDDGSTRIPWAKPRHLARLLAGRLIRARRQ